MRWPDVSAALVAAFVLAPVAAGFAPATAQDFSITNQVDPADASRRDMMRQLQALWDSRAYYPLHASNNDESGTVKIRLRILPDGRIWTVRVVGRSASASLASAGAAVFRDGFVRPLPEGAAELDVDLTLRYVLTYRGDEPVAASYKPGTVKGPFTISNDPLKSPTLDPLIQRTCTGKVIRGGIRNHPAYGWTSVAEAVFFRRPDGAPWVKFYEGGYPSYAPVTEVGRVLQWTGREEHLGKGQSIWTTYSVWPDGENHLIGNIGTVYNGTIGGDDNAFNINMGGTAEFSCATEIVPPVTYNAWLAQTMVTPPGDPP